MRKAIGASVLVLLLACSAQAGWIHSGVTGTPPPPSTEQEPTASGYIHNDADDSADGFVETVLNLLGSLLP